MVEVMEMKVENIQSTSPVTKLDKVEADKNAPEKNKGQEVKEEPAAVFEKSEPVKKGHVYDKATINKLKLDSQRANQQLIRIVEELLKRQGKTLNLLNPEDVIEVDEQARAEAAALIGPDGDLGVEAVSQRIVDFAIAISGGDKSKLETLRGAIDKGFKEAEKILGGLPDISKETYKAVMEKLDAWGKSE